MSIGSVKAVTVVLKLSWQIKHDASPIKFFISMRHSTLVPWLQNGQLKTVSSLSIRFFGGGFALDFLLPIFQLKYDSLVLRRSLCSQFSTRYLKNFFLFFYCFFSQAWPLSSSPLTTNFSTMGYFSCSNAQSAIAACASYELLPKKARRKVAAGNRPAAIIEFDFSDLHAATDGFSPENLLGRGSHGSVYRARLRWMRLVAAVKRTKQTIGGDGGCAADNEVEILSGIYHPRLVNLIGFGVDPDRRKVIVVEYMPNGSLNDALHGPGKPPGWVRRVRFAVQVAWAVQFLHSSNPPVIHRDIKSSNVLIDGDFNCRVSDFGLALRGYAEDVRAKATPPAGTLGYLDPSYLAPGDLSAKSDVFSFGILLLEIISGRNAIDVGHSPPSVVDWAVPAIRSGDFDAVCDPRIGAPEDPESLRRMAVLAARCVRPTAGRRPGMAEALECLRGVYRRIKRRSGSCAGLRRRVERVGEGSRAAWYESLDDSVDVARNSRANSSRRSGRVSSAAGADGPTGVGRSKSMGTASEIKLAPSDYDRDHINRKRGGLSVRMTTVRLRKSRSMGILQGKRLINGNGAVTRSRTCTRKLEESKLLVDLGDNIKGKD